MSGDPSAPPLVLMASPRVMFAVTTCYNWCVTVWRPVAAGPPGGWSEKRGRTMGGQGGDHIDVEWLGYERSAPSTNRERVRWRQVLAGAAAGAFAALAAVTLVGSGTGQDPAAATPTTTSTTSTTLHPPLDGLNDVGCVPVGGARVC